MILAEIIPKLLNEVTPKIKITNAGKNPAGLKCKPKKKVPRMK
jgi:hypothetical protein